MVMSKYVPRLKKHYHENVRKALMAKFQYRSIMQVPVLQKIVINQGVGKAASEKKLIENAVQELSLIAGQKAVPTYAKKDISNFKLRKGIPIGVRVTLRGDRMYEFLDRLISVAIPRTRDFRGLNPRSFDGRGNYTIGVKEQIIFPEIDIDKVNHINGYDITLVTSSKTDEEARALLEELGLPIRKK